MTRPLIDRGALAEALGAHGEMYDSDCGIYFGCACGWDNDTGDDNEGYEAHVADALLASPALDPATWLAGLAEDEAVVDAVAADAFPDAGQDGPLGVDIVPDVIRALAAALSPAQSERAEVEHG